MVIKRVVGELVEGSGIRCCHVFLGCEELVEEMCVIDLGCCG